MKKKMTLSDLEIKSFQTKANMIIVKGGEFTDQLNTDCCQSHRVACITISGPWCEGDCDRVE